MCEEVVISGVGGFFPKAKNIREFQNRLFANEDLLSSRWGKGERGVTNVIGRIANEYFDNAHFGIHRNQTTYMDSMHRKTLEATYEALIDAGVNPTEIKGKRVACFIGSSVGEHDNLFLESIASGFGITGHSRAMMPNRISYWLDLKGPSIAYDSNWLSGIEVLRLANETIKNGDCDSAIVGCANLVLNSEFQWLYNDMGLLSKDGITRPFDNDAQGYGRSDGIVVFYIQRASVARRSYASIVRAETFFDGNHDQQLLSVNADNLAGFISNFYAKTNVNPSEIQYVEAYGCGIKKADQAEVEGLEKAYCKNRKTPLLIGSVKSNAGHSEACAAFFSIAKALIALETDIIPATIHFKEANSDIKPLQSGTVQVVTKNKKWSSKYIAVNFVGLTSCYGHLLLKSSEKEKQRLEDNIPRLVFASGRTEDGIRDILTTIETKPFLDVEYIRLLHELFSKSISGHIYRGYTILGSEIKRETSYHLGNKRQVWFVYSGMGSQWCGMVSDLMKIEIFANAINKCHNILKDKDIDLLDILSNDSPNTFDNILHSFVGIAAIQIGLTDVLKKMGIVPDGIIGHSVGELGCAYADGCMTAEQMILAAYSRGRASLEAVLIDGMMAAIGLGYNKIKDMIPPTIEVACHNGPDSCTISGPSEDMRKFVEDLQNKGVFARLVNVSNIAYHSRYIQPAAPGLLKYLNQILPEPKLRSSKWISTSNHVENWNSDLAKYSSAEYHTNNLLSSVLFEEGLQHIPKDAVLIEIAPHGLLQAILKRSVKSGCTNIALTQRGTASATDFLLASIGKLFLGGLNMDISVLYPPIEFPVAKGTDCLSELTHWEHSSTWRTGLEDKINAIYGVKDFAVTLNSEDFRDSIGHQIDNNIILPYSCYLRIVFDIVILLNTEYNKVVFENLTFTRPITVPKTGSIPLHAMVQRGSGQFEVLIGSELILKGTLLYRNLNEKIMIDEVPVKDDYFMKLNMDDIYKEFYHRGYKYSDNYKMISNFHMSDDGIIANVKWHSWTSLLESMLQLHLFKDGECNQDIFMPKMIEKVIVDLTQFSDMMPSDNLDVFYHFDSNLVYTKGLQLFGLKTNRVPRLKEAISFDCVDFISLQNQTVKTFEDGVVLALALLLNNNKHLNISQVLLQETKIGKENLIKNKDKFVQLFKNYFHVNIVGDPELLTHNNIKLTVCNYKITEHLIKYNEYLVGRTTDDLKRLDVTEVFRFSVNNISFSLIHTAKLKNQPLTLQIDNRAYSSHDLFTTNTKWVNELITFANVTKSKGVTPYLILNSLPTDGIKNFASTLFSLPYLSSVRIIASLNTKKEALNSILPQIMELNLKLTVVKNGVIGTKMTLPHTIKDVNALDYYKDNCDGFKIKFLGLNSHEGEQLKIFDYSGVSKDGINYMGVATFNSLTGKIDLDPIFKWNLPYKVTLENAATIPYAFVCAYYLLIIKGNLQLKDSILIHSGATPLGVALISIAIFMRCRIYTTVDNKRQRLFLRQQFKKLLDSHIFETLSGINFETFIKTATLGNGANVIVNTMGDPTIQATASCLAAQGRFLQISRDVVDENTAIGLGIFSQNATLRVINLKNVMTESDVIKTKLKQLMEDGFNCLAVIPMEAIHIQERQLLSLPKETSCEHKVVVQVTNTGTFLNNLLINEHSNYICDASASYLIYGGCADLWINLVEWLVFRGACNITVVSDYALEENYVNRRLLLLKSHYNAKVALKSLNNEIETHELILELSTFNKFAMVFFLEAAKFSNHIFRIDTALRSVSPETTLINFVKDVAGIFDLRNELGYPTLNIEWENDLDVSNAFLGLDTILIKNLNNVFIKNDNSGNTIQETTKNYSKLLKLLLPSSIEKFSDYMESTSSSAKLIQMSTFGPRKVRELAPIFVIPGLAGHKEITKMCLEFLYPTYLAVLPTKPKSIEELAKDLVEKILKVWPNGAYNIVSVSWGGALSIEIARLLSQSGKSLHLYFIDSAPSTIQTAVEHFWRKESSTEIESILINKLFNLNNELTRDASWEDFVKEKLQISNKFHINPKELIDGIKALKMNLEYLKNYKPNDYLVNGKVHLIRPVGSNEYDCCDLLQYCKLIPQIILVAGDHLSIVSNPDTINYINERHYLV